MQKSIFYYFKTLIDIIRCNKFFYWLLFLNIFNSFYTIFIVFLSAEIIANIEAKNLENIYFWIIVFIVLTIFLIFVKIFYDGIYFRFHAENSKKLTEKFFKKFIFLDNTATERYGTGKFSSILNTGIQQSGNIIDGVVFGFVQILMIIYAFVLIFFKVSNIWYFLGFLLLFFCIIGIFWISLKQIFNIRKDSKKFLIEIDRKKIKILMSKFEIFQNKKIDSEIAKISQLYDRDAQLVWKGHLKKGYFFAMADGIFKGFEFFVFLVIGVGVVLERYEMATFALLLWILKILSEKLWDFRRNIAQIMAGFVHWEKLIDIFDEIPEMTNTKNLPKFIFKKGKIEFQNVDFSYENEKNILKNFSLLLQGGKKYALVGESGGGKTTILKLLSAYMKPNSGKILIDDQDLSGVSLESFYENIGYLSQESSIFDGTIYENLVYSLENIPNEKFLKKILADARCDFVFDLENGLNTEIGERGIRLSGGQKQRLAIAKIMLKNPRIILLDEATSALDSLNESQISEALQKLFSDKTVLIVTHRLQTVKNADTIFFLENGKIIETGSHTELLAKKGKYFQMIELQSGF